MDDFLVSQYPSDGAFVIDSRLIASYLEIGHSDWMQNTIKKYQPQTEQAFGVLRFENGKPETGSKGGRPEIFVWLTEEQALFYITLSKNSLKVVECKTNLVKAFIVYLRVEQRSIDGFINATAMCTAHKKDVSDWLKTDDTWELVVALADDLGISPKNRKSGNSVFTRVSATYPSLVVVKRGSPDNGGGTWLHPDLAIQLAQWCNKPFAIQVSRWVREWFIIGKNPVWAEHDIEQQYAVWQERYDIRIELKDILRPELMEATRAYAVPNGISPITLCSTVHDVMNERIQGAKSKDIKTLNGLPLADLLRDYFDTKPLHTYAAINRIVTNKIVDSNIDPIQAVHEACDVYLGGRYTPKLFPKAENLYIQQRRVQKALKAKQAKAVKPYQQLSLFDNDEAV